MVVIATEVAADTISVRAVHMAAFPTPVEADLVDRLRANGRAIVSLVAREGDQVLAHLLFSPVTIHSLGSAKSDVLAHGLGLAPLAVLPKFQRRGVGSTLIRAGIDRCRENGAAFIVVLGEPAYYARFGFEPASRYRLESEYNAGDAFQVLLLEAGVLPAQGGLARYAEDFAALG
jgi:putative acetyltransferase